jgi:hypothetical protein
VKHSFSIIPPRRVKTAAQPSTYRRRRLSAEALSYWDTNKPGRSMSCCIFAGQRWLDLDWLRTSLELAPHLNGAYSVFFERSP